jgi:Spy/CpxP family protein refolding chaperone
MKRTLLLVAFLLAVLAMAAAGVAIGRRVCPPECGTAGNAAAAGSEQVEWLTRTLTLTPEQRAAAQRLETQYRGTLAAQCSVHCAAKARLQGILFTAAPDEAAIGQLLEAMAAAQTASERATLEHIRQIHSLLTPAQRPLYEAAVIGSVCGCRSGLHGCADSSESGGQRPMP